MKMSKKIAVLSIATLLGGSPVVALVTNSQVNAASTSTTYNTYGKNSKIKTTNKVNFVDKNGKKTSKVAPKNASYIIWNVKQIKGELYYSIQTNLKYWLPATATKGTVEYKESDGSKVIYTTNGTSEITVEHTLASKKTSTTKKKSKSKTSTSSSKIQKITMKRKAYIYDKNGKRVKNYYGTSYIGKGVTIKSFGTKTIKGERYYRIEANRYFVKVADVK